MTAPPATVWADRLLARPGAVPAVRGALIEIAEGRIGAVGPATLPDDGALGGPDGLVMPALANAHDHGRGARPLAYGVADAPVELWVPGTYSLPPVDPYLVAAVAFGRMARGGVGSVLHCHLSRRPEQLVAEAEAVARAACDVGIRLAFVVPLRDRHRLGYGADAAVLDHVAPERRAAVEARFLRPVPDIEDQLACVEEIARRCAGPGFHVQYGPVGAEWCSDRLLERVAEASAASGRRVHMHLLESARQRKWADATYRDGLLGFLDGIGLLGPRLSLAHGVWLRPGEAALLAARGVAVSVNTSSNLRLRSGVAPLADLVAAGVPVALGLDALALDDDEDMLREARLAWRLHGGTAFEPAIDVATLFKAATQAGPRMMFGADGFGRVEAGAPADLLLLDYAAMSADLVDDLCEETDVLLARARAEHVRALVVAGRPVLRDGRLTGLDLPAAEAELTAQLKRHAADLRAAKPDLDAYRSALRRFYAADGHCC